MVRLSTVKGHLTFPKKVMKDTGWRTNDLPPRHGPYPYTRPAMAGWEWRSFELHAENGRSYRMLCEVEPRRGKWKAMLIHVPQAGAPVAILRLEDQPGPAGGLHVHAGCDTDAADVGAESVNMRYTLPDHGRRRRRHNAWTKALFCSMAGVTFRTEAIEGQEEMAL